MLQTALNVFCARHRATLVWFAAAMMAAIATESLFRALDFAAIPIVILLLLLLVATGVAVLAIEIGDAAKVARSRAEVLVRASGSISIVASGALLFPACVAVAACAMMWTSFLVNYTAYSQIVDDIQRGIITPGGNSRESAHGVTFMLDAGPPMRVAFPDDGGLIDNWTGIVYDPDGSVATAHGFTQNGGFTAPDRIKRLFGGDLVSCSHMIGSYYRCTFT